LSWNFSHLARMSWNWLLLRNNMLQFTVICGFAFYALVYSISDIWNLCQMEWVVRSMKVCRTWRKQPWHFRIANSNAIPERGFSVNNAMLGKEKLSLIVAQRVVKDCVSEFSGLLLMYKGCHYGCKKGLRWLSCAFVRTATAKSDRTAEQSWARSKRNKRIKDSCKRRRIHYWNNWEKKIKRNRSKSVSKTQQRSSSMKQLRKWQLQLKLRTCTCSLSRWLKWC